MIKLLKINEHYIHPDRLVYAWAHYRNQRAMFKVDAEDNGTTIDFDLEGDAAQRALVWLDANSIDILATTPAVDVDVKELQGRLHAVRCLLDLAQNERGAAIAEREQWKANANNAADHYGRVLTDRDEWRNEATRLADELDAANTDRTALRADLQKARDRISDFHALQAELAAAQQRIASLKTALEQYANTGNWGTCDNGKCHCEDVLRFEYLTEYPWEIATDALEADND